MGLGFACGIGTVVAAIATSRANVGVIKWRLPSRERSVAIFAACCGRDVVDSFSGDSLGTDYSSAVVTREAGRHGNLAVIQFLT
jgi:hypothetical protein